MNKKLKKFAVLSSSISALLFLSLLVVRFLIYFLENVFEGQHGGLISCIHLVLVCFFSLVSLAWLPVDVIFGCEFTLASYLACALAWGVLIATFIIWLRRHSTLGLGILFFCIAVFMCWALYKEHPLGAYECSVCGEYKNHSVWSYYIVPELMFTLFALAPLCIIGWVCHTCIQAKTRRKMQRGNDVIEDYLAFKEDANKEAHVSADASHGQ